ncbi:cation:proton antiporter [Kitasatospora sp. LaBMicrA B282]|uniref:cation:proton antiporter n=1 Tax=Kitasatospora sp. LaBMicrA B282 TaxID=3420949 RepID=UPI003D0B9266
MTTQQTLLGAGLIVVLAVGSQILAARLRIPAIIVLLPVGFAAGAFTDDVHPDRLLGPAFGPLVSLAVAVILYDAGLGLDLRRLVGHNRTVVLRLIWIGALLTPTAVTLLATPLLGLDWPAALMLGTILMVSGPTVVGPLLGHVRPTERLARVLLWEGSLIDAIGGILGALVFHAVSASARITPARGFSHGFLVSVALGLAGAVVGVALLWLLLRRMDLGEMLGSSAQLAVVVGVAAGCDAVRDDAGLIAAVAMGVALASLPGFEVRARRPFLETLVSLIVGLLFVAISASVTPASLRGVGLPALALAGVLVVAVRPLITALATLRTDLRRAERAFVGWMAPRGIVAASTASTFSAELVSRQLGGAAKILPATFVVIVATVTCYGLTAAPVARRLGVIRPARSRPLLVGADPWVLALGRALRRCGLDVLVWAGSAPGERAVTEAGLDLAPGDLPVAADASGGEGELAGITEIYLLTAEDDFNALAATLLRTAGVPVRRLPPRLPAGSPDGLLFAPALTAAVLAERHRSGAEFTVQPLDGVPPAGHELLFTLDGEGRLVPVTGGVPGGREPGDPGVQGVLLGPAAG